MAKKITKKEKQIIINTINGWADNSITWQDVCEECKSFLKNKPSRQALSYHKEIYEAFKSKKNDIKNNKNNFKQPSSITIAVQRIFNLEAHLKLLEDENTALKKQFVYWQYNASKHGITKQQLNEPLPPIDRERTDRKLI